MTNLLQQALDALEDGTFDRAYWVTALREALAAPMPEPGHDCSQCRTPQACKSEQMCLSTLYRGQFPPAAPAPADLANLRPGKIEFVPAPVVPLTDKQIQKLGDRRAIFQAGRDSYETPAAAYNTDDEAWAAYLRAHGIGGGEQPVVSPMEDPGCHYIAPMGKVCKKCGRIHRGIGGGGK